MSFEKFFEVSFEKSFEKIIWKVNQISLYWLVSWKRVKTFIPPASKSWWWCTEIISYVLYPFQSQKQQSQILVWFVHMQNLLLPSSFFSQLLSFQLVFWIETFIVEFRDLWREEQELSLTIWQIIWNKVWII